MSHISIENHLDHFLEILTIQLTVNGKVNTQELFSLMENEGILQEDDFRFKNIKAKLKSIKKQEVSPADFQKAIKEDLEFIERVINKKLQIQDFQNFIQNIQEIAEEIQDEDRGNVATYIPQLAKVPKSKFAVAFCSVDGQRYHQGDFNDYFCVQSTSKVVTYTMALTDYGTEYVHEYIGNQPSGIAFNALKLDKNGCPHNPLINSGAIMSCSLIKSPDEKNVNAGERFSKVLDVWTDLTAQISPVYMDNPTYLSESGTADRNFALGHFMKENRGFPPNSDLKDILEFYFQCCSISCNSKMMAILAATFANQGKNPITGKEIFAPSHVKNSLSLMYSCGMYDYSGQSAFHIGIPAKSGVSGCVIFVIPNIGGFCVWSPALDEQGNSVKAIEFAKRLNKRYNFHQFQGSFRNFDPTQSLFRQKYQQIHDIMKFAQVGDLNQLILLYKKGVDLNIQDYDYRSPLHLACQEGITHIAKFLIETIKIDKNIKDRWDSTCLDYAYIHQRTDIIKYLERNKVISKEISKQNYYEKLAELDSCKEDCVKEEQD